MTYKSPAVDSETDPSTERYELLIQAMSEGVYDWDIERNFLYVSNRLNEILRFNEKSLTSNAWADRVHEEDLPLYSNALRQHFRHDTEKLECEYRIRDGNDEFIWIRDRGIAVRNEAGRAVRLVGLIEDITDEKETAQALDLANQERDQLITEFNTVLDTTDYGIMFLDAGLNVRFINRAIRELWDLEEEFIAQGPHWSELLEHNRGKGIYDQEDEDWVSFVAERTRLLEEASGQKEEVTRADGSTLQVQFIALPDGGRMLTYLDITSFRKLEEELRQSDARYAEVMEAVEEGVYDWNVLTGETYYSPALNRMLKLERPLQSRNTDWIEQIHPDDLAAYREEFAGIFRRKETRFVLEYRFLQSDSEVRWARQRGIVDYDESGRAVRVVGSTGDITREINMRSELDAARVRMTEAIEAISEGFVLFDASDRIVICNSKFSSFFSEVADMAVPGTLFKELLRTSVERDIFDVEVSDFDSWFEEIAARRRNPVGTREQFLANGLWLQIGERRTSDGGLVAIYTDVTDLKRTTNDLRLARDEAERTLEELTTAQDKLIHAEKMASLGQLTAGIAHEIKNPLNFVNNFARLGATMLSEYGELTEPLLPQLETEDREDAEDLLSTIRENLAKIEEHGRRADGIVKNMLLHSREGPSESQRFDFNTMLRESLNLAYHGARAEDPDFNVTLTTDYDETIGDMTGHPQDLTRVFLNLLSNGFYATEARRKSGQTDYQPELVVISKAIGERIEVTVRDNGIGMPEEIQEKIFNPFFTTKPPGDGTGLGLSMSFDIISKQHKGELVVSSKVGHFTEFKINLPRFTGEP